MLLIRLNRNCSEVIKLTEVVLVPRPRVISVRNNDCTQVVFNQVQCKQALTTHTNTYNQYN